MDSATFIQAVGTLLLGLIAWGIKAHIQTTFENTVQIKILNQHIEELLKLKPKVEKIENDLHVAHERIRALNGGTK